MYVLKREKPGVVEDWGRVLVFGHEKLKATGRRE